MAEEATSLQDKNKDLRIILDTISNNGHDKEIAQRLRSGESYQSIAVWLYHQKSISKSLQAVQELPDSLIDAVKSLEQLGQGSDIGRRNSIDTSKVQWTKVISSQTFIRHLFDLYFTWVHPIHMVFSELDFKQSFQANVETYCSSPMVNAICAMACHLLDNKEVEAIGDGVNTSSLREAFMTEARVGLPPDVYHRITSIQTLAIMYLVDVSSRKARRATGYLRSAVEHLERMDRMEQSAEAIEISVWGIQALNTYSLFICSPGLGGFKALTGTSS